MTAKSMANAISTRYNKTQTQTKPKVKKTTVYQPTLKAAPVSVSVYSKVAGQTKGSLFKMPAFMNLNRFLILGTEGKYKSGVSALTKDMANCVRECLKIDGIATVDRIVEISQDGAAPKNEPALLALAICASSTEPTVKRHAMEALPAVARIGTHLFAFAEFAKACRGWGRLLREGTAKWYSDKDVNQVAFQAIKYRQRNGWSHRDLLRLTHPHAGGDPVRNNLYKWIVKGPEAISKGDLMPPIVIAFEQLKTANLTQALKIIADNKLPWEAIPTELLNQPAIWDALLPNMKPEAMVRNLGKMTSIGLLEQNSNASKLVISVLSNQEAIIKARYHPIKALVAGMTYKQGKGNKGSLTWTPNQHIVRVLDDLFYLGFKAVEPTGKTRMICLDVSPSMSGGSLMGTAITPKVAAAVLAMVTMRTEPAYQMMAFCSSLRKLPINETMTLEQVVKVTTNMSDWGGTDCSLPMRCARMNKLKVDSFEIYTDNDTNAGGNPHGELKKYRDEMGVDAKMVVIAMTLNDFTIADPKDPRTLDVVGFDTAAPQIMSDFVAGKF